MKKLLLYIAVLLTTTMHVLGQADSLQRLSSQELNNFAQKNYDVDFNATIQYASLALDKGVAELDSFQIGVSYTHLANAFEFFSNYEQANKYYNRALTIFEQLGHQRRIAATLNDIGLIYWYLNDLDRALAYYSAALSKARKLKDLEIESAALNRLGLAHTMKHNFDSAALYFENSYAIEEQQQDSAGIARHSNNVGILFQEQKEYSKSIAFFGNSLKIKKWTSRPYGVGESYNNLAYSYFKLGDLSKASAYLDSAFVVIDQYKIEALLLDWYRYAAQIYKEAGDLPTSFKYYELYLGKQDSVLVSRRGQKVKELMAINAIDDLERVLNEKENQLYIAGLKSEKQVLIRNASIVFSMLLLGSFLLVFNRQRAVIRKREALVKAENSLQIEQIRSSELEKQQLNSQLEFKQKELTNLALYISEKNHSLQEVKTAINVAVKVQDFKSLIELNKELELQITSDKDKALFNDNIETLYSGFLFTLKERFETLSPNEHRLCCQLRLNLSSKEISNLNHISVKSVEVARYRLRKKLGLKKDENLTEFLLKV